MYVLVYMCKGKRKKEKKSTKNRGYASDNHVASVILSVYYAERWAGNNSFSRVLRSVQSDPLLVHRASRIDRALCAKTQEGGEEGGGGGLVIGNDFV